MAKFSDEWRNLESPSGGSGNIPDGVSTIADSLAATTVSINFISVTNCGLS